MDLQDANPWAVRWMADLEELEPYDERGVIQRMGRDVRALFLDRELAEDFVAMDVTISRLRSLAVEVPPWDFREEAGHPVELSEEGVPQWKCCFDEQCEARFESFKTLATRVVRHHSQMEVVSRSVITNQCPVCLAVYGNRKAAHRHLLSSLRRGSCRDRSRCLGQVHIPRFAQPNVEIGQNSNSTSLNICQTFSKMTDFEMPSGSKRKPEEAPQGQGRRAVRQAVAEGRNDRDVTRRLVHVMATLFLVNAAQLRELTATVFQDVSGSSLGERGPTNGRSWSTLPRIRWRNQEQARSGARRHPRVARSPVCACVGGVPAQSGGDEGAGTRTRGGIEVVLGEQRGEERTVERSRA